jgi:hypothetical protein
MLSQGKRPICARLPLIKDLKDLAPEALLGLSAKRFARCLSTRLVVRWNGMVERPRVRWPGRQAHIASRTAAP